MPPLPAPFSTGASSSAENQPKPGHVAVNSPCAVAVRDDGAATAAPPPPPPQAPHAVVLIIPATAEAPVGTTASRARGLWAALPAYMALAVPAVILLQAAYGESGPPFLVTTMLLACVFAAALFGVWVADQRALAAAEADGQLVVLALQDSP